MFVGHYAASFALKSFEKRASLGILFLAVQFVDILFFPFVLINWGAVLQKQTRPILIPWR